MNAGRSTPRAYQDERFSYVALRRGPRPVDARDLSIRRQLVTQPVTDADEYRSQPSTLNTSRASRLVRISFLNVQRIIKQKQSGLQPVDSGVMASA